MSSSETCAWTRFLPQSLGETGSHPLAAANTGRRMLVTGAGGYIGSALVKAIAGAGPRCIVLLDSSESNLFEIQRHLEQTVGHVPHQAFLGSVGDADLLDGIFSRFHPEIVYHAAAFKHVPLLEQNPIAAVRNNALGTWALAQAAVRHGASMFVLISTDKAVNPHSVMGVSKRIAELTVVALSGTACRMNAIRLGNVIGSRGSVVPVFLKQIAESRPVTVTHPEVSRWFLSLRQTVDAILAAGAAACEGRILLPELGEPVQIAALAAFLIRAAGKGSGKEIAIHFTGLRPGDKLREELTYQAEMKDGFVEGPLDVINPSRLALVELEDVIDRLSGCITHHDGSGLIRALSSVVPEYVPSELVRNAMASAARVGK
jgi:FlaA1/EpsC-like NDP-sugar epimerase